MSNLCICLLSASATVVLVLRGQYEITILFFSAASILAIIGFRTNRTMATTALLSPFIFFFVVSSIHHTTNTSHLAGDETFLSFYIHDHFHLNGNQVRGMIKTKTGEKVMLALYLTEEAQVKLASHTPGQTCSAKGSLQIPPQARNQFAFNYKQFLFEQRTHWIFEAHPASFVCDPSPPSFKYKLSSIRSTAIEELTNKLPEGARGLVVALTLGERRYVDPELLDAYSKLGIIHLLAISGLHVGLISAAVFYLLIRIGVTREAAMIYMLVGLPVFAILTGAAPPVVRASAMAFVYFLLTLLRTKIHPFYGFAFIFFGYLLIDPYKLFQLGFQLSFLVSFSLILMKGQIQAHIQSYTLRLFAVTTIAQLVGLPLIFYHFFEWSPFSLLLNMFYIPFISFVVLPLSFLSVLTHFLSPFSLNPFIDLLQLVIVPTHRWILALSESVLVWVVGRPPLLFMVAMYMAIMYVGLKWEERKPFWWVALFPLVLIISLATCVPYIKDKAIVTMLDVGQGDCFIIEMPYRQAVYVIDTGGHINFNQEKWSEKQKRFDTGRNIVVPYLKAKGIGSVTALILTHGDHDHIGGAAGVLDEIDVRTVVYPKVPIEKDAEKELLRGLEKSKMHFVEAGDKVREAFYVLHPSSDKQWSANDGSVVLYGKIAGRTFLFTGDLEEDGEQHLVQTFSSLKADILKVGHHGSLTSTTDAFLQEVSPKIALISAGVTNRFGHPHPDVITKLEERGIVVLRTDLHGTVEIELKNNFLKIEKTME